MPACVLHSKKATETNSTTKFLKCSMKFNQNVYFFDKRPATLYI